MATDTKERILDVAESLFADNGFATTSLRDITTEAGVNLASVNYHFGSKEGLLLAVLSRRVAPINTRRLERLEEVERRAGDAPELEEILRAFLTPPFEMRATLAERGDKFFRLMGRVHTETNDEFRQSFMEQFRVVFTRFTDALQRALPELDPAEHRTRMWFLIGSMAYTMMWGDPTDPGSNRQADPDHLIEALVQFGAAGLSAPSRQPVAVGARRPRRRRA